MLGPALIILAAATWFMTGVIWFVQVNHYPLMGLVGEANWVRYERGHRRLTGMVVGPVMVIEVAAAVTVIVLLGSGSTADLRPAMSWIGGALIGIIWFSTFRIQVPLHDRLSRGFDVEVHRRLVRSNWLRTAAWSVRSVLVGAMLA